jgi:plasmid stabilization system protein ParE
VPAKFRVRITRTAERDVEEAWAFITQDSPEEAEKFVSRLEEQIKLWSVFPNAVLSFPKTKHSVLAIDIDIRQLPQRISKSRKNGLHFARHPWRETPRQFDVRGLESDIAKAATGDAFMVSQLRKHGKTH